MAVPGMGLTALTNYIYDPNGLYNPENVVSQTNLQNSVVYPLDIMLYRSSIDQLTPGLQPPMGSRITKAPYMPEKLFDNPVPPPFAFREYTQWPIEVKESAWENIPIDLRAKNLWGIVNRHSKKPINVVDGKPLSVDQPQTWGSYADCVAAVQDGLWGAVAIGRLLVPQDDVTVVDFDGTLETGSEHKLEHWQVLHKLQHTYREVSYSGKGFHALVKGSRGEGKRSSAHKIEIYSQWRFVILTGIRGNEGGSYIIDDPIGVVDKMYKFFGEKTGPIREFHNVQDLRPIEVIKTAIRNSKNSGSVVYLMDTGYPPNCDKSAEDAKLAETIFFHTKDHILAQKIFESSACWDEERIQEKSKKRSGKVQEYIQTTLRYAFSQVEGRRLAQERASDIIRESMESMQKAKSENVVTLQSKKRVEDVVIKHRLGKLDPIELPDKYGALKALYCDLRFNSYRDFPHGSLVSALTYISSIIGDVYVGPTELGLNIYGVLVAPSGWGKEDPMYRPRDLIRDAGMKSGAYEIQPGIPVPDLGERVFPEMGSQEALLEHLSDYPIGILTLSEFAKQLRVAFSRSGSGFQQGIWAALTSLYTTSKKGGYYAGRKVRDKDKNITAVSRPCLSMIGEATPTDISGIPAEMFKDGMTSRYLFAPISERPLKNRDKGRDFYVLDWLVKLFVEAQQFKASQPPRVDRAGEIYHDPYTVGMDESTRKLVESYEDEIEKRSDAYLNTGEEVIPAIMNRMAENLHKIMAILAVCRSPVNPKVDLDDFNLARQIVEVSVSCVTEMSLSGELGGKSEHKIEESFLRFLARWLDDDHPKNPRFQTDVKLKKQFPKFRSTPTIIPYNALLQHLKILQGDDRMRAQHIRTFVASGYIAELKPEQLLTNMNLPEEVRKYPGKMYAISDPAEILKIAFE